MPNDTINPGAVVDPGVADLALAGLLANPKSLPPQLFYDEEGCRLFYRITDLPEYYLTRTEWALLPAVAEHLARRLPPSGVLVEYGASHEGKAGHLLKVVGPAGSPLFSVYVPIDVAATALLEMGNRLKNKFPALETYPIVGDFEQPLTLSAKLDGRPKLGFFPGSTIGNLDPDAACRFLRLVRGQLGSGAGFLLGADLRKPASVLIPAYDDAAGVTAAFNRNLLVRLNREAGAAFDPLSFSHQAVWNEVESRIEMHLISRTDQVVRVAGRDITFKEGESIHTENSYKFSPEGIAALAEAAGWFLDGQWFDEDRRFGMFLFRTG